jgi:hypothetical protein
MRKLLQILLTAVLFTAGAAAGEKPDVSVCLSGADDLYTVSRAETLASTMLRGAGASVEFHGENSRFCRRDNGQALTITFVSRLPPGLARGTLASAWPYEGSHIAIYYDQLPPERTYILAHILVHEIAHMLEGTIRHSDFGVMNANWSRAEVAQMRFRNLPFTELDKMLIQAGITPSSHRHVSSSASAIPQYHAERLGREP